jgi:peptide/nickel transport system substrate-binding protein
MGSALVGTGPFFVADQRDDQIEMQANRTYFPAAPAIDRIVIKPYTSVRAAWADMLRGQVDVLYDVGVDALDSLEASRNVKVYTFQRGYAYVLLLNLRKSYIRDADFRRLLNAAVDRDEIVRDVLRGHGAPASGPVWPQHWAYTPDLPKFRYQPRPVVADGARRRLTCIFSEPSYERLALVVQRQLQAVGVDLELELVSDNRVFAHRLEVGDFDAFLTDIPQGPPLVRPYLFWHSRAPFNVGQFSSQQVDDAFDAIRHAADDSEYKAGVAAFQRAIVNDPPAIFLAWRERARAVSTRFLVPVEPGADILTALHLWRPASDERLARRN